MHRTNKNPERYLIRCDSIILCDLATKLTTPFEKGKRIDELLFNILQYTDTFTIREQLLAFIDQFKDNPDAFRSEYQHFKQLKEDHTNLELINSPTVHKFIKIIAMGNHFSKI